MPKAQLTATRTSPLTFDLRPTGLAEEPTPPLWSFFEICEGQIAVSIDKPDAFPIVDVESPTLADSWLRALLGQEGQAAVKDWLYESEDDTFVFETHPGGIVNTLARYGYVGWLKRWWPSQDGVVPELDSALLEIELGSLANDLSALMYGPQVARSYLAPHAERLISLAETMIQSGISTTVDVQIQLLVGLALDAGADTLPRDAAMRMETLSEKVWDLKPATEPGSVAGLTRSWESLVEWAKWKFSPVFPRVSYADVRGPESQPPPTASVDWLQVHPGLLDTREETVSWDYSVEVDEDGAPMRLQVLVEAAPRHRPPNDPAAWGIELFARLYTEDDLPIAVIPLRPAGEAYSGIAEIPFEARDKIRVDIATDDEVRPPRLSEDQLSQAKDERAAIRSLAATRLNWANEDLKPGSKLDVGPDALTLAELLPLSSFAKPGSAN